MLGCPGTRGERLSPVSYIPACPPNLNEDSWQITPICDYATSCWSRGHWCRTQLQQQHYWEHFVDFFTFTWGQEQSGYGAFPGCRTGLRSEFRPAGKTIYGRGLVHWSLSCRNRKRTFPKWVTVNMTACTRPHIYGPSVRLTWVPSEQNWLSNKPFACLKYLKTTSVTEFFIALSQII